jgi:hypothetical protein
MVAIAGRAEALRGCQRQRRCCEQQVSGRTSAIAMPAECGEASWAGWSVVKCGQTSFSKTETTEITH